MHYLRVFVLGLALVVFLAACVAAPDQEKVKVYCPACGTDFDALYHKRF